MLFRTPLGPTQAVLRMAVVLAGTLSTYPRPSIFISSLAHFQLVALCYNILSLYPLPPECISQPPRLLYSPLDPTCLLTRNASMPHYLSVALLSSITLLSFALVAGSIYIRIFKSRYTEKQFHLVAVWAVTAVTMHTLSLIGNTPPWSLLNSFFGLSPTNIDIWSKVLLLFLTVFFIVTIWSWSKHWSGLLTQSGHRSFEQGKPPLFILDGFSETGRLLRLHPPHPSYIPPPRPSRAPILPNPLNLQPFRQQVLDLILGKWTEYIVDGHHWVEEALCWRGKDTSRNQTVSLLIVCAFQEGDIPYARLREQISDEKTFGNCKLIIVIEKPSPSYSSAEISRSLKYDIANDRLTIYTYSELISETLPLARYRALIYQEFNCSPLPNTDFPLSRIFVETRIREQFGPTDHSSINLDHYLTSWLAGDASRHLALLGDYGQGKSTAALELTFRILHDDKVATLYQNRVPILMRLTGQSPKTTAPEDLFSAWGGPYGLNGHALLALHRAGRTLLIFDAFDEMANVADRADRFDHFGALWRYACPGARILFTGRPNFFLMMKN